MLLLPTALTPATYSRLAVWFIGRIVATPTLRRTDTRRIPHRHPLSETVADEHFASFLTPAVLPATTLIRHVQYTHTRLHRGPPSGPRVMSTPTASQSARKVTLLLTALMLAMYSRLAVWPLCRTLAASTAASYHGTHG